MSYLVRTVRLDSVARIVAGGKSGLTGNNFVDSGYPAFGAGGFNGFLPEFEFEDDAIILSTIGARCGKCFYPVGKWASLANTQLIFPNPELVDRRFLWYQLNDESLWHRSGTAQPYIKPSDVKGQEVPLPPLPEQRRIADILDRADDLRAQRRRALSLTEQLLKSQFISSFESGGSYPVRRLVEVLATPLRNGISPAKSGSFEAEVLTLSAVTQGRFDANAVKISTFAKTHDPNKLVRENEFLICRGNGNKRLVGRGVVVPMDMGNVAFPDTIIGARFNADEIVPTYVAAAWARPDIRRQIEAGAHTTNGTFKINQQTLEQIEIRVPPISLQNAFLEFTSTAESQARASLAHLNRLDDLFASLQHRAFRGEL